MEKNDRNFGVKSNYQFRGNEHSQNQERENNFSRTRNNDQENKTFSGKPYFKGDGKNDRSFSRDSGKPRFSKPPKAPVRQKTETQDFLEYQGEKIPTFFPVPAGAKLPEFQRAVGMAKGTIKSANIKGTGTVDIAGFVYPLKENRNSFWEKKAPLSKFIEKEVSFTFYPTITMKGIKILNLTPDSPPFVKIANLRKELPKENFVEVLGRVKVIGDNYLLIGIYSEIQKKEYVVYVFGSAEVKKDDFVKADCSLENGLIKLDQIRVFA